MIVRVSGQQAHQIAGELADELPAPGHASRVTIRFAELSVPAWVYVFASPRSYTGEDLVEFHIPGNPLLARMLLEETVKHGARHAEAGEFTARAYFAGKMDLTEAEGVAAAIGAHSQQELDAARQLLGGELSRRLRPAMDALAEALSLVEAGIDFSDEDVSFISGDELSSRIDAIDVMLEELVASSSRFEPLTHEPTFALVGRPNAGKSTLLNALAGHDRAVVSAQAGTTRDALVAEVRLKRGLIRMIDLAGLENVDTDFPRDGIAGQMQRQALRAIETADRVIYARDATDSRPALEMNRSIDLLVTTKLDLTGAQSGLAVSALTGEGMDALRGQLDGLAFGELSLGGKLALNARHLHSLSGARASLERAGAVAHTSGSELVALELRDALDSLGQVLGQVTPDDVLGRVFATFCIGK